MKKISQLLLYVSPAIIVIILFVICNKLDIIYLEYVKVLLATLLMFILPGYSLLQLMPFLSQRFGKFGKIALVVFLSIVTFSFLQIFLRTLDISNSNVILLTVVTNMALVFAVIVAKFSTGSINVKSHFSRPEIFTHWPLLLTFFVIAAMVIISPLAQDADGFLTAINRSVIAGQVTAPLRQLFVWYYSFSAKLLGVPPIYIFRLLPPFLYFISTLFLYDYAQAKIENKKLQSLVYLSLLIAPVILIEANIIRPQVMMVLFILPVLIMSQRAISERDSVLAAVAVVFSFVATVFHELGIVLLGLSTLSLLICLCQLIFIEKVISFKNALISLVIIFPYLIIFKVDSYFGRVRDMATYALGLFGGFHWRWWFIDNYVSMDGHNLGWPGIMGLYYYAYNGLQLFATFAILFVIVLFRRKYIILKHALIPGLFVFVFLIVAEIMPRIGFFFLPNRAWVNIATGLLVGLVAIVSVYEEQLKNSKIFITLIIIMCTMGVGGTMYVSQNNVSETYREESGSVQFIKNTAANSIFISSQENRTIVTLYGGRNYLQFEQNGTIDKQEFEIKVEALLHQASLRIEKLVSPDEIEHVVLYRDGLRVREFDRVVSVRTIAVTEPTYTNTEPVYFYYSMRKSSSINATREYLKANLDLLNKDKYINMGYDPVYQDGSVIILRLR
jgi:hypothetical protein